MALPRSAPAPGAPRCSVGLIGAGRVGAVVTAALAAAGHPIAAVTATSAASRARAATLLPGVPVSADPSAAARTADVVLLAVPDDALADLVAALADAQALRPDQLVVHTSGRHGVAVLAPASRAGACVLALHPAMTFTGTAADVGRLPGVRWGVTGDAALAAPLLKALRGVAVPVSEQARPGYHAALAHGANHLVTLVSQAAEALRAAGVDDTEGVLRPLLGAALDRALRDGDAATTGPVVRGDAGTVAAHLRVLPTSVAPSYRALARDTAARAVRRGALSPEAAADVLDALAPPPVIRAVPTGISGGETARITQAGSPA